MAKWSIAKFFSIVIFIVMMIFFFFWITNQVSDLGLFFGFRTSHTVANDLAGVITSVSGVPGETSVIYDICPGTAARNPFNYEILVSDGIVCVTSFLNDESKSTTDCAAHPAKPDENILKSANGKLGIEVKKKISEGESDEGELTKEYSIDIKEADPDCQS